MTLRIEPEYRKIRAGNNFVFGHFSRSAGLPAYKLFRFLSPFPTLFSNPRLLILENFVSLPFYSRLPVYQFMRTVDSGSVKPKQSHKTV